MNNRQKGEYITLKLNSQPKDVQFKYNFYILAERTPYFSESNSTMEWFESILQSIRTELGYE